MEQQGSGASTMLQRRPLSSSTSLPSPGPKREDIREYLLRMEMLFEDVQAQKEVVLARASLRTPGRLTPSGRRTDPGDGSVNGGLLRSLPCSPSMISRPRQSDGGVSSRRSPSRIPLPPGGSLPSRSVSSLDWAAVLGGPGSAARTHPARQLSAGDTPHGGAWSGLRPSICRALVQQSHSAAAMPVQPARMNSGGDPGSPADTQQAVKQHRLGPLGSALLAPPQPLAAAVPSYFRQEGAQRPIFAPFQQGLLELATTTGALNEVEQQVEAASQGPILAADDAGAALAALAVPAQPQLQELGGSPKGEPEQQQQAGTSSTVGWNGWDREQAISPLHLSSRQLSGANSGVSNCFTPVSSSMPEADDSMLMASPVRGATEESEGWQAVSWPQQAIQAAAQAPHSACNERAKQPGTPLHGMPLPAATPPKSAVSAALTTPEGEQYYSSPSILPLSGSQAAHSGGPPTAQLACMVVSNTAYSPRPGSGAPGLAGTWRGHASDADLPRARLSFTAEALASAATGQQQQQPQQQQDEAEENAQLQHHQSDASESKDVAADAPFCSALECARSAGPGAEFQSSKAPGAPTASPPAPLDPRPGTAVLPMCAALEAPAGLDAARAPLLSGCSSGQLVDMPSMAVPVVGAWHAEQQGGSDGISEGGAEKVATDSAATIGDGGTLDPERSSVRAPSSRLAALARLKGLSLKRQLQAGSAHPLDQPQACAFVPEASTAVPLQAEDSSLLALKLRRRLTCSRLPSPGSKTGSQEGVEAQEASLQIAAHRPAGTARWDSAVSRHGALDEQQQQQRAKSFSPAGGRSFSPAGDRVFSPSVSRISSSTSKGLAEVTSSSPSGSGPVGTKPFLRRRSCAVVPQKLPDWSQVRPRTDCHLDPYLRPASRSGMPGRDGYLSDAGSDTSGSSRPGTPLVPTLTAAQPGWQPCFPSRPVATPQPASLVLRGMAAAAGSSRGGTPRGITPRSGTPRTAGATPRDTASRPPWGSSRPGAPTPKSKAAAAVAAKERQRSSARTTPFSPPPPSHRGRRQYNYEAASLLAPSRFLGAQLLPGYQGDWQAAAEGRRGLRAGKQGPEEWQDRGAGALVSGDQAGPLDDLLGHVDRLLSQVESCIE